MTTDPMTLVRWLTAGADRLRAVDVGDQRDQSRELEILLPRYQSDPRPVYALYTER